MARKKRVPTELKLIRGTYRADRHGPLDAQARPGGEPTPPRDLRGEALRFWKRIVPPLVALGVAKAIDTTMLTEACRWWQLYKKFAAHAEGLDPGDKTAMRGLMMATMMWKKVDSILTRFGLSPVDRAGLKVAPPSAPSGGKADKSRFFIPPGESGS